MYQLITETRRMPFTLNLRLHFTRYLKSHFATFQMSARPEDTPMLDKIRPVVLSFKCMLIFVTIFVLSGLFHVAFGKGFLTLTQVQNYIQTHLKQDFWLSNTNIMKLILYRWYLKWWCGNVYKPHNAMSPFQLS